MNNFLMYFLSFYFGAIMGSFFYALSLRLSSDNFSLNALFGRSHCPSCKKTIPALFLIPLFGYIFSKGRCAYCNVAISPTYPLMEILYGLLAVLVLHRFGFSFHALNSFLSISIAIAIAVVDIQIMKIPSSLLYALLVTSIPFVYRNFKSSSMLEAGGGFLLLGFFFITILLVFPGSFGGGDMRFAAVLGLATGFRLSIVMIEISLLSGTIIGIFYGILSKKGIRIKIPFAPFLAFGFIIALLWGNEIIQTYYQFFLP